MASADQDTLLVTSLHLFDIVLKVFPGMGGMAVRAHREVRRCRVRVEPDGVGETCGDPAARDHLLRAVRGADRVQFRDARRPLLDRRRPVVPIEG